MNHQRIAQIENLFRTGQRTDGTFQKLALKIPNESAPLPITAYRPEGGYNSYYYQEETNKEKIVIHHTAGHLQGDFRALTQKDYHVSVPFLIARDGSIYQLHHSKHWSYHLGPAALGGNKTQSKKAIGIELSNYGYLVPRGDHLETYHSRAERDNGSRSPIDRYCSKAEKDLYVKLPDRYRRYTYYASFTKAQHHSLIRLLRYLTKTYNIPTDFLPEDIRYAYTNKVIAFKGIVSHVNYRKDKFDIGPPFDWDSVIQGVQSDQYNPAGIDQVEQAQKAYEAVEKAFQLIQVKIWETNSESAEDFETLEKAEEKLVAAHLELQRIKAQKAQRSTSDASSLEVISEDGIDRSLPLRGSRTLLAPYGEDGPVERIFDYGNIER